MSGLEILIPMIFDAVASTVATVATAVTSIGAAVFSAAAAIPGMGLISSLGTGVGGFLSTAIGGGLGAVVGGAVSTGITGAIVGGLTSVVTGGDFLKGVEMGGLGGAVLGGLGAGFDLIGSSAATGAGAATNVGASAGLDVTMPDVIGGATGANVASAGAGGLLDDAGVAQEGAAVTGAGSAGPAANLIDNAVNAVGRAPLAVQAGEVAAPTAAGIEASAPSVASPGLFDGLLDNKEVIGGALSGVGKVLSGDTQRAAALANNKGAMDRQVQGQQYLSGNYSGSGGLLDAAPVGGQVRPVPSQAFAGAHTDPTQREYFYDPNLKQLVWRTRTA